MNFHTLLSLAIWLAVWLLISGLWFWCMTLLVKREFPVCGYPELEASLFSWIRYQATKSLVYRAFAAALALLILVCFAQSNKWSTLFHTNKTIQQLQANSTKESKQSKLSKTIQALKLYPAYGLVFVGKVSSIISKAQLLTLLVATALSVFFSTSIFFIWMQLLFEKNRLYRAARDFTSALTDSTPRFPSVRNPLFCYLVKTIPEAVRTERLSLIRNHDEFVSESLKLYHEHGHMEPKKTFIVKVMAFVLGYAVISVFTISLLLLAWK